MWWSRKQKRSEKRRQLERDTGGKLVYFCHTLVCQKLRERRNNSGLQLVRCGTAIKPGGMRPRDVRVQPNSTDFLDLLISEESSRVLFLAAKGRIELEDVVVEFSFEHGPRNRLTEIVLLLSFSMSAISDTSLGSVGAIHIVM